MHRPIVFLRPLGLRLGVPGRVHEHAPSSEGDAYGYGQFHGSPTCEYTGPSNRNSGLNWLGESFQIVYFEKIRVFKAGLSIMP